MSYLEDKMFCDKCGEKLEIKRHDKITRKILRQSYFFYEWGSCRKCHFIRMFNDKKILIDKEVSKLFDSIKYVLLKKKKVKRIKQEDFIGGYKEYIKSKCWDRRKIEYYSNNKKKCVCCGKTKNIHLHHIVYGSFGNEQDKNLAPLCGKGFNQFIKEMKEYKKFEKQTIR